MKQLMKHIPREPGQPFVIPNVNPVGEVISHGELRHITLENALMGSTNEMGTGMLHGKDGIIAP